MGDITRQLLTGTIFGALILMYADVIPALVSQWIEDANYSHCFLVPLISIWLVSRKLPRFHGERKGSLREGLPFLLPGLVLFLLGNAAAELFTMRFSMLLLFWGLVRGLWGAALFRYLSFPLFFLVFMVPLPYVVFYRIAFPLQLASAAFSSLALDFIGVPMVRSGNIIHLGQMSLDVVTACSGLRGLLSLITFAVLFAGIFPMRGRLRALLIFLAVPTALAGNALRIIVTAILVHLSGKTFLDGVLHQAMGLLTFGVGVGVLFLLGGAFRWQRKSA